MTLSSGPRTTTGQGAYEATHPRAYDPRVVAHRGACGYRPEHTLAAYSLAVDLGADAVELDLVSTADGILVARHENELSRTTDVALRARFADRRQVREVDGERVHGWFCEDFTLAELRSLRAVERVPRLRPGSARYDGRFGVPTLDEVLALVAGLGARRGVTVGVFAELKHVAHQRDRGLDPLGSLLATLRAHHLDRINSPVVVASFEVGAVRTVAARAQVPVVQLVDDAGRPPDTRRRGLPTTYADLLSREGLAEVAAYAVGVGLPKRLALGPRGAVAVAALHTAGLESYVYTLRDENRYLAPALRSGGGPAAPGDAFAEYERCFALGVDAVISDFPDTAVQIREWWRDHRTDRRRVSA